MKIVVIGDIHGRSYWRDVIRNERNFDVLVFVGDYWDSFDISFEHQMYNFLEIIEFKENMAKVEPNKVIILLLGNHDWHYLPYINDTSISGYQTQYAFKIKELMRENHHHFTMAYESGDYLFSHAGISEKFLNTSCPGWTVNTIVRDVNELFKHRPLNFEIVGPDPYGRNINDSPTWIRPKALMYANADSDISKGYIQVFGHTAVPNVQRYYRRDFVGYNVDTFDYGISYLRIMDGDPQIINL